jgi:hypothetical protein
MTDNAKVAALREAIRKLDRQFAEYTQIVVEAAKRDLSRMQVSDFWNEWIDFYGETCPCPQTCRVDILRINGEEEHSVLAASVDWRYEPPPPRGLPPLNRRIVGYRISAFSTANKISSDVANTEALQYFNALWASIEKHMGVDPECAHWPVVIRRALCDHSGHRV